MIDRSGLAAQDGLPDVLEGGEDGRVVPRRVQGQVPHQELAQRVRAAEAPPGHHLHHRAPEVGVRVVRPLHYRRAARGRHGVASVLAVRQLLILLLVVLDLARRGCRRPEHVGGPGRAPRRRRCAARRRVPVPPWSGAGARGAVEVRGGVGGEAVGREERRPRVGRLAPLPVTAERRQLAVGVGGRRPTVQRRADAPTAIALPARAALNGAGAPRRRHRRRQDCRADRARGAVDGDVNKRPRAAAAVATLAPAVDEFGLWLVGAPRRWWFLARGRGVIGDDGGRRGIGAGDADEGGRGGGGAGRVEEDLREPLPQPAADAHAAAAGLVVAALVHGGLDRALDSTGACVSCGFGLSTLVRRGA
uniref:Uncharacterized protein n=1 Tax=Setaria italica TaxID=4555 RepID=K3Z7C5_SETIT